MAKKNNIENGSVKRKAQSKKSFKYADVLENCEEAIGKYMSEPNGVYYRLVHNPCIRMTTYHSHCSNGIC